MTTLLLQLQKWEAVFAGNKTASRFFYSCESCNVFHVAKNNLLRQNLKSASVLQRCGNTRRCENWRQFCRAAKLIWQLQNSLLCSGNTTEAAAILTVAVGLMASDSMQ